MQPSGSRAPRAIVSRVRISADVPAIDPVRVDAKFIGVTMVAAQRSPTTSSLGPAGRRTSAQLDNIGTAQQRLYGSHEHGFTVFASHVFSNAVRANLGYGFNFMKWYSFIPASVTEPTDTHTLHANVINLLNLPATAASRLEGASKYMF